jgi:hypothetical protein
VLHVTTRTCTKSQNWCGGGTSSDYSFERVGTSIAEETQRSSEEGGTYFESMAFRSSAILTFLPNLHEGSRFRRGVGGRSSCARFFGRCKAFRYPLFLETLLGLPGGRIRGRSTGNSPPVLAGGYGRPALARSGATGESLGELLGALWG